MKMSRICHRPFNYWKFYSDPKKYQISYLAYLLYFRFNGVSRELIYLNHLTDKPHRILQ
jgi:hypothetical protein